MSFKLTADTDPATIMFEGFPDVKIDSLSYVSRSFLYAYIGEVPRDTYFPDFSLPVAKGINRLYNTAGEDAQRLISSGWPNIVPRVVQHFDVTKPLFAKSDKDGTVYPVVWVSTTTFADGSEPVHKLRRASFDDQAAVPFHASTGRVVSGFQGSALHVTNAHTEEVTLKDGNLVLLTLLPDRTIKAEYL